MQCFRCSSKASEDGAEAEVPDRWDALLDSSWPNDELINLGRQV